MVAGEGFEPTIDDYAFVPFAYAARTFSVAIAMKIFSQAGVLKPASIFPI